ncbi:hypothetical protein [Streptomyces triticirhizae]|uniref:Cellulose-binding protein n=1 Tax=Streptomyces triticirhizae TaxID=2483353 RepID=A0A3M2LSN4_9ACTN|nr:hypothetical protein [Streptomyces triticirhizae]RMI40096.1 hypothetical protein EBN88_13445 [Streptomyces triticirhizae]
MLTAHPRRPRGAPTLCAALLALATALLPGATAATATPAPQAAPPAAADHPDENWNPPAEYATGLDEVWRHMEETYPDLLGFPNYGWDHIMANGGTLQYCVRWESTTPVTAELRDQIHATLDQQVNRWIEALDGFDGFPYARVPVTVVGWAAADRSTLRWDDDAVDLHIGDLDAAGAPRCAPECDRFHHQDGDYSQCPGGEARHFDQSLWLTDGFGGGAGGDWGQRMGSEYLIDALGQEDITILLHEIGHTLGLDDFYDWTPTGVDSFLMRAGSAQRITDFDAWMARDFWRHLKPRYQL